MSRQLPNPSTEPPRPVYPLGQAPAHGPAKHEHIVVVIGAGPGVGGSVAKQFAALGYTTAILSRNQERLDEQARELHQIAAHALGAGAGVGVLSKGFACDATDMDAVRRVMQEVTSFWPEKKLGTAVYNASIRIRRPFLEQTDQDIRSSVAGSIYGGWAFAQSALHAIEAHGQGGTLLFTGASASLRGRRDFASFNAAKAGLRALAQSIAKEYQPRGVHVAHIVIDGLVDSQPARNMFGMKDSERFPDRYVLRPEEIAKTYVYLAQQDPDVWTHEVDLRPAREHF